jgi:hypothetical protein
MDPSVSPHFIAAVVLVGRLGDIGSTWLATPKLALEANPVVRRLGWRFAWLTTLLALLPYYDVNLGVMVAVPSLMVTAGNLSRGWFARALGEHDYVALMQQAAKKSGLSSMIAFTLGSAGFMLAAGVLLLIVSRQTITTYFALGVVAYALAIALHGSIAARRTHRAAVGPPE